MSDEGQRRGTEVKRQGPVVEFTTTGGTRWTLRLPNLSLSMDEGGKHFAWLPMMCIGEIDHDIYVWLCDILDYDLPRIETC